MTRTRRMLLALPTAMVAAALLVPSAIASPAVSTAPVSAPAPGPVVTTTQGIIMRDGGVCDPIRHMGC
jgi:hypothetical protein